MLSTRNITVKKAGKVPFWEGEHREKKIFSDCKDLKLLKGRMQDGPGR